MGFDNRVILIATVGWGGTHITHQTGDGYIFSFKQFDQALIIQNSDSKHLECGQIVNFGILDFEDF